MPTHNLVLSEDLRLIEQRGQLESAKLEALRKAADKGWSDITAGHYDDVADDTLQSFIAQLGEQAAERMAARRGDAMKP